MLTLWFMQAALKDISSSGHDSQSFAICQRVLHVCHEIIFSDPPAPTPAPYVSINLPPRSKLARRKVKHHLEPALVGIGLMWAGSPGMPQLTEIIGQVAIEQGRIEDNTHEFRSVESRDEDIALGLSPTQVYHRNNMDDDQDDEDSPDSDDAHGTPIISDVPVPGARSRRRTVGAAQTVPALPLHLRTMRRSRASEDPLGQLDADQVTIPYSSSPSISSARSTPSSATINRAGALLEIYDKVSQTQLLRGLYADVVLFLGHTNTTRSNPAPSPDNFEPTKRSNKEVLKKIVTKEDERKGTSKDLVPFNVRAVGADPGSTTSNGADVVPRRWSPLAPISTTATAVLPGEDEEIDLVEQLYGTDQAFRSRAADLSESIVLPPAPKNRELEMVAWSRSSSQVPSTPIGDSPPRITTPLPVDRSTSQSSCHVSPSSVNQSQAQSPSINDDAPAPALSLDDYSERMRTAAIMLAQLNANLVREQVAPSPQSGPTNGSHQPNSSKWLAGSKWLGSPDQNNFKSPTVSDHSMKLQYTEAAAIRDRIMKEMMALEEQRMERMRENREGDGIIRIDMSGSMKSAEDEGIIRRELNKADPSAVVVSESWTAKKSRIRHGSPYGHLANWDCVSVIVKTGGDLRQEQLAVQLIQEFQRIWEEEKCPCWVRHFRILITGGTSGLVETITDAVSIHSIKKAEYARRNAEGKVFGHVTLMDHFKATWGDPASAKFARAQRNFAKSLAGYSVVTYLLQVKDRHNGNILLDRDGHLIHIDFGFILSNTPGNMRFEAAPFKLPTEYIEVLGGIDSAPYLEFRRLFRQGFEAARKHCDRIITLVELMQKDSTLPCFAAFGEQTAAQLRERFQPVLTHSLVGGYVDRLIDNSLGSHWTRLYDSYQYYSQSIL
ncbi:hypothetical protein H0H81_001281 [Sphagnurus paluster]|uniref:1-phosphatidylinositol 4-kinase n=1 Tax=Sphagnurus paluster TaxID=117069 RepID=A0A9P7FMP2_9AGAR|nr:hypothetical protein H0H81_001281 [Sphagnurus paluster]